MSQLFPSDFKCPHSQVFQVFQVFHVFQVSQLFQHPKCSQVFKEFLSVPSGVPSQVSQVVAGFFLNQHHIVTHIDPAIWSKLTRSMKQIVLCAQFVNEFINARLSKKRRACVVQSCLLPRPRTQAVHSQQSWLENAMRASWRIAKQKTVASFADDALWPLWRKLTLQLCNSAAAPCKSRSGTLARQQGLSTCETARSAPNAFCDADFLRRASLQSQNTSLSPGVVIVTEKHHFVYSPEAARQ